MDPRASLERDRGKANILRVAEYVGSDPDRFADLLKLVLNGGPALAQRAAWTMSIVCEHHSGAGAPWIAELLGLVDRQVHEGICRNAIRSLQFCELPEKFHGRIFTRMSTLVLEPSRTIGERAFAISVAMRMVDRYPELGQEMELVLEESLRLYPGPAIHSRASKGLKKIRKASLKK